MTPSMIDAPSDTGTRLQIRGLRKTYGANTVLHGLDLDVAPGEVLSLLGESGCGKTTVLQSIAGFVVPDGGEILFDGQSILSVPPERRRAAMLFQGYALFPHMSVRDNVGFGLRMARVPREDVRRAVDDVLKRVRIDAFADRRPDQLSGGQKQRVALARAIVTRPRLMLLDEPLGALDQNLREDMQSEILALQRAARLTTIVVTHDQAEAMTLSDRIAVLKQGRIEQIGTPMEIFDHPATRYVARFMGVDNILTAESDGCGTVLVSGAAVTGLEGRPGRCLLAIRAAFIVVTRAVDDLAAVVTNVRIIGTRMRVEAVLSSGERVIAEIGRGDDAFIPSSGDRVGLRFPPSCCSLLPAGDEN